MFAPTEAGHRPECNAAVSDTSMQLQDRLKCFKLTDISVTVCPLQMKPVAPPIDISCTTYCV